MPSPQRPGWKTHVRRLAVAAGGLLAVLALGVVDYYTGYEISFAVFYVLPVAWVTWYGGTASGVAIALLSAFVWQFSNSLAGERFSHAAVPYWNAGTRLVFLTIITYLLSRVRQLIEHERELSRTDSLTGLLNRRAFYDLAAAELDRQRRHGHPFSVAYVDVDDFKSVNDRAGHAAGDALLVGVAETLRDSLRATDLVSRLGGDEFAALLIETEDGAATRIAEGIRARLLAEAARHSWPVTFSIGLVTCTVVPPSVDALVSMADAQMYRAKREGKNRLAAAPFQG